MKAGCRKDQPKQSTNIIKRLNLLFERLLEHSLDGKTFTTFAMSIRQPSTSAPWKIK
jgi:hypothetical protein